MKQAVGDVNSILLVAFSKSVPCGLYNDDGISCDKFSQFSTVLFIDDDKDDSEELILGIPN